MPHLGVGRLAPRTALGPCHFGRRCEFEVDPIRESRQTRYGFGRIAKPVVAFVSDDDALHCLSVGGKMSPYPSDVTGNLPDNPIGRPTSLEFNDEGRRRRFALMEAIAAVHADWPSWDATDGEELVGLYDLLLDAWPSPVVALNRAVAVGFAAGPAAGLAALEPLESEPQLTTYGYLASARADLLRRLGRIPEALVSYEEALAFTENAVERSFLARRIADLKSSG